MPISVAVPVNKSAQVRALKAKHPYMTPEDIAATTGTPLHLVNVALSKGELRKKPKSRLVEARGPLTARDVAMKTGMPLSSAKLMVR